MSIINGKLWIAVLFLGLTLLPVFSAESAPLRVRVTSMGSASDSDRSSASDMAKNNSESTLFCTGRLEDVQTRTNCAKIGDNYLCTASSAATCVIGQ